MADLSQIARIMIWHHQDNNHDSPGIFIGLPREIARQFPKHKEEDSSPQHITVLILNKIPLIFEKKVLKIVQEVCEQTKPFLVRLGKPRKFVNPEGQIILHSPIRGKRLIRFHDALKSALMQNGISVDNKFPTYEPHTTIAYVDSKKELKQYKDIKPIGEWFVDQIWIWGFSKEPKLIILGK